MAEMQGLQVFLKVYTYCIQEFIVMQDTTEHGNVGRPELIIHKISPIILFEYS